MHDDAIRARESDCHNTDYNPNNPWDLAWGMMANHRYCHDEVDRPLFLMRLSLPQVGTTLSDEFLVGGGARPYIVGDRDADLSRNPSNNRRDTRRGAPKASPGPPTTARVDKSEKDPVTGLLTKDYSGRRVGAGFHTNTCNMVNSNGNRTKNIGIHQCSYCLLSSHAWAQCYDNLNCVPLPRSLRAVAVVMVQRKVMLRVIKIVTEMARVVELKAEMMTPYQTMLVENLTILVQSR